MVKVKKSCKSLFIKCLFGWSILKFQGSLKFREIKMHQLKFFVWMNQFKFLEFQISCLDKPI